MNNATEKLVLMDKTYEDAAEKARNSLNKNLHTAHKTSVILAKRTRRAILKHAKVGEQNGMERRYKI